MELRHLRYFLSVVDESSFTRAAEKLQIAQSPLSQQIRKLERELGVQLLTRTSRSVAVTTAGAHFYERACAIVKATDDAASSTRRIASGDEGQLTVGFTGSATYELLPALVRAYRDRHPAVTLHPRTEMLTAGQVAGLMDGSIDVGVLRPWTTASGIVVEVLRHESLVALLPSNHPVTVKRSVGLLDLQHEKFIAFPSAPVSSLRDVTAEMCAQAGFVPSVEHVVADTAAMVTLVSAGLGVAIVPASLRHLRLAGATFRPLEGCTVTVPLALAYREGDRNPLVRRFVEAARAIVRSRERDGVEEFPLRARVDGSTQSDTDPVEVPQ